MSVLLSNITFLLLPFLKNSYYLKNQLDSESHIVDNKLHTLEKLSNINDLRVMFDNNLTFDNYILFPVFLFGTGVWVADVITCDKCFGSGFQGCHFFKGSEFAIANCGNW